ncbi:VanZ family protein [Betaproteobacteria bacterium SCN1]|jgi:glycopeptide antibiotics resistance protein|nr:VanZ family protein [Betaproteobacteria bacterium SCN1]
MSRDGAVRRVRTTVWLAALAYTVFVVYGSLVPLKFQALPWDEAVARFAAIPFLNLGIGSRADWVANLLLFIPLTFLWMGAAAYRASAAKTALIAALIVPIATALSIGIEFTQLFFPQRTVSQNDIFAETLGGMLGVAAWLFRGRGFLDWLQGWQETHARAVLAERLAWAYLAGLVVYNVLPLDLTISVVELFHKWREGRVVLIPFAGLPAVPAEAFYEILTDVLIWVPLAVLWRQDGSRSALRVWTMTLGTAVLIEGMQLFVYSRVSDVTDILTGALGAAAGSLAGGWLSRRESRRSVLPAMGGVWLPLGCAAVWVFVVLFTFWFPFDFRTDGAFIRARLDFLERLPFEVYYFGTEYRAATEVLRKTLFFAPLGACLVWGIVRQPWRWRGLSFGLAMLVLAGLPAVVEFGQVMLPEKIADTTDWLLAWLGGLAGYAVARRVLRAPRIVTPKRQAAVSENMPPATPMRMSRAVHFILAVGGMAGGIFVGTRLDFVPYNVRELLNPAHAGLAACLMALAVYWLAVFPVWLARREMSGLARMGLLPFGLLVYGGIAFLLLDGAVPDESLFDLAGSPILDWPGHWETGLRWVALLLVPGASIYLAAQSVRRWRGKPLGALHFWVALLALALAYWVVVVEAATDNLVELIASPGLPAWLALCGWLYLLCLAAALLASPLKPAERVLAWTVAGLSLPLGGLLLYLGLAQDIDKYGQHFSAMQFLLSRDRQHYAPQASVWLRYAGLHVLVIVALAFLQWPHFRAGHRRVPPALSPSRP